MSQKVCEGWVLTTPGGKAIADTFSTNKGACEGLAYDYLAVRCKAWACDPKFWKQWDLFVKERERRGWTVEKAKVIWFD